METEFSGFALRNRCQVIVLELAIYGEGAISRLFASVFKCKRKEKKRADERTRTADLTSDYEFACTRSSPSYCVRFFGLFMGFSAFPSKLLVHCVLACTSPVAVRLQYVLRPSIGGEG